MRRRQAASVLCAGMLLPKVCASLAVIWLVAWTACLRSCPSTGAVLFAELPLTKSSKSTLYSIQGILISSSLSNFGAF